jgi:hypothetical protein
MSSCINQITTHLTLLREARLTHVINEVVFSRLIFVRYGSVPIGGPSAGLSILDHWQIKLKKYYKVMGWDENKGMPHKKTIKKLGLEKASKMPKKNRGPHK